jgi:membrane protein YqaA with SNARE-associated domain
MAGSLEVPLLNSCAGQEEEEEAPRRTSKTEHFGSEIVTVVLGHAREILVLVAVILVALWFIQHFFAHVLKRLGKAVAARCGLPGLFGFVVVIDYLPLPVSYVPLLYLLIDGGEDHRLVFVVSLLGSVTAALCGYLTGAKLGLPRRMRENLETRHPTLLPTISRRGAFGLLASEALPVPMAVLTWPSGACGIGIWGFLAVIVAGRGTKLAMYCFLTNEAQKHFGPDGGDH